MNVHLITKEDRHIHSSILTQSAQKALQPLGMFQKGHSRVWRADRIWWLAVVEFQPSGFSKGSYLNVGCMWLWNVKPHLSFDEGGRLEQYHRFENPQRFTLDAEQLAQRAAKEVPRYHTLFPSIQAASDYYLQNPPADSFWPEYNAAIAHGLAGRSRTGAALLARKIGKMDPSIEWQLRAGSDAELLLSSIHLPDQFEQLITARVLEARKQQKLAPLANIDFRKDK